MGAIAFSVATAALSLALSGCGSNSKPFASASSTALQIAPDTVDFGDVTIGTPVFRTVSITNPGTSDVQISQLTSSSSAFTVTASALPATLPGGGEMQVQVRYDPGSTTDSTGQLSVDAKSPSSGVIAGSVKLHGKGASSLASLIGLSCASSSIIGGGSDTCTVKLSAPASGSSLVNLTSNSSAVLVPVSVTVPSGASSATFAASTSPVSASQTVTLTATQGTTSKSTSIQLSGTAAALTPSISAFSCGSASFTGAGTTTCTLSLSSAAPSTGLSLTLTSNSSAVTVPSGVTVGSGASTASFTATVASVTTAQTATVAASSVASSRSVAFQLNPATSALSLSATSLAFGNVSVGTAVSKSVTVTSTGTVAVTVNSASATGTGYSVSGGNLPATLNPGQAAVLTVQFDPTSTSSVNGQLTISSNATTPAVSLSGTGTTVAPTVSGISCSTTSITGSLADSCTVSLSGSAPTGGLSVGLSASSSAVTVPGSVTVPAASATVAFTANVAAVASAQTVTLTANSGSTSRAVSLQLNTGTPALTLNATSIAFGGVVLNTPTTQTVTLTSSGTAVVTVNSLAVTGSGFSASPVNLPANLSPGQAITVTLTFDPAAVGSAAGQLTVGSTSSTNPTVTVPLTGTGDPHQVELSWQAPSGSSIPITGYNVYRAPSGSSSYAVLNSMNSQTAYNDLSVQSGQTYNYYVTSVDSSGVESAPSNVTTVAIP